MALISASMLATLTLNPRASRSAARLVLGLWIGVLALLLVLLGLALWDWCANRAYARRHRAALRAEERAFWAGVRQRHGSRRDHNGHSSGKNGAPRGKS